MAQEEKEVSARNKHLFSGYRTFITYRPLRTEVAMFDFVALPQGAQVFEIPARAGIDPLQVGKQMKRSIGSKSALILIPGKKFDASGTRHGQGGGWYDRFLSEVPREWLRIGFCFNDQFSSEPLRRESWDQAMDYVVVVNRATGRLEVYSSEGL